MKKALVAYFSASGVTQRLAKTVAQERICLKLNRYRSTQVRIWTGRTKKAVLLWKRTIRHPVRQSQSMWITWINTIRYL